MFWGNGHCSHSDILNFGAVSSQFFQISLYHKKKCDNEMSDAWYNWFGIAVWGFDKSNNFFVRGTDWNI